jgi:CheY-like chemotaxis protein
MKKLLLVDQDISALNVFSFLLKTHSSFFTVLTAQSSQEAIDIITDTKIDMIVAAAEMEPVGEKSFFSHIGENHPDTRLIATINPESAVAAQDPKNHFDVSALFEKPVDISALTKKIFNELQIGYGGKLHDINLGSFLQVISLEEKTCVLKILKEDKFGYIYLSRGELTSAETGELKGEAAACELLTWDNVSIIVDYTPKRKNREITKPLIKILMTAMQMKDEIENVEGEIEADRRKYPRRDCELKIDCEIEEWSHRGILRNTSDKGAFIETDQPISVGQEITISINPVNADRPIDIACRVVRRSKDGIGVEFIDLNPLQLERINSLVQ